MVEGRRTVRMIWEILLQWAISNGDKSFIKSVNKSSRDKILKEEVVLKEFEKFKSFIKHFSHSQAYLKIRKLKVEGIVKNLYDDLPRNWIYLILQLHLQEIQLCNLEWVGESLFSNVGAPLSLTKIRMSNLPITGKTMETLLAYTPFLTSLALDNLRCVNDALLEYFPVYLPNLRSLSLEGASITSAGLESLFLSNTSTQDVDYWSSGKAKKSERVMDGISSRGLMNLETLNIADCFGVDDIGLRHLAESGCALRDLNLRGIFN